ncbi:hypothetical protein BKE38_19480 [Pseudoroseomonas deserti]|uniref:Translation initiation factor IF-2 n=1 Tax=Teichococcus deserti TaxID=1817963 RepID=A0A1V2GYA8_9PROT|nr:hypothetical protein [Pseudoroseomonas deserti]ONG50090.1 hypothetical protein BKE38_19480 [Pseudoroseomonas deserti]
MRVPALVLAAGLLAGPAFAQTGPGQDGGAAGQSTTQPASPGQGNGSDPGGSNPGGFGPAGAPRGDGNRVDSEFGRFRVDAQGRAPLSAPPGSLDAGQRAPSQPPAEVRPSPWLQRGG